MLQKHYDEKNLETSVSEKILMIGLAETGKTTIIKVVTEGYAPDKKAPYTATLNYDRKDTEILGKKVTIFDLGGQDTFLKRFTSEISEFIFSNVIAMVFVVDISNITEIADAKYYLDLSIKLLKDFSPSSSIYVLFHKTDLVSPDKITELTKNLKDFIKKDLIEPIKIYETSVFSDSIFQAMGFIIGETANFREGLGLIINEFIKENDGIVEKIQLFSEDGVPLISTTSDFYHASSEQTKKILDDALQYASSSKEYTSSVFIESEYNVYFVRFLVKGITLFISCSKKGIMKKKMNLASMYEKITVLSNKLYIPSVSEMNSST
ncbi:MAG: ADP-ribosylation factor-like protein [Candidatus Hodarchaeales archaeon]|jgi:small GTP-binding protein